MFHCRADETGGLVVCDGDSITAGYNLSPPEFYPTKLGVSLGSRWTVTNTAVTGRSITEMTTAAPASVDPQYHGSNAHNIVAILGGINDLVNGASSATVIARLSTYCAARRSVGWQIIIGTIMPSGYDVDAQRLPVNTELRTNLSAYADWLADFAADPRFADIDGPYYDGDRLHPSALGTDVLAELVRAQVPA